MTATGHRATAGGLFVALEGGDGAGKSTQARLLAEALEHAGHTVVVTREPGGTELGHEIRKVVLHGKEVAARAEALLFAADRAQHVETVVRPALARGEVVLTDRYIDSSIAYQGGGRDLGRDEVRDLNLWAVRGLLPDLTIVLDVSAWAGRGRREAMAEDRLELEPDGFHERVREGFLDLAATAPARYLVVDGRLPVEEIHGLIMARVGELAASR